MRVATATMLANAFFFAIAECLPYLPRETASYSSKLLSKRGLPGAVYICTDPNFRGDCGWVAPSQECRIAGTGLQAPESIGPDPGGFCVLYADAACKGNQIATLRFPGIGSGVPAFSAIRCLGVQQEATKTANRLSNTAQALKGVTQDDPRLAGGVGSMSRKRIKAQMERMEQDGFSEGLIGLRPGEYY
ncbi:hypothetical protein BU24DRAFT_127 [Aaosphaeria arxii CBS 175.79]|uniref:Uncharacterized protein n=1 Tax=Aaosphaeria arxii CBS 175.79 TaxID=1450172 RepID=A0A6A5Y4B6_9PLEO|nr:uncharacterized protein BU24DRAFT_127 [Aaosphaeria arxii CBS 175.79]KAF2020348.1 hypothetical protein BU24DRAFT_127 [Aaosphaeria arxii CBS 175.79]